ncbi:HAD family hydrolase [Streptomyces rishiriensis]|uniref:HAD family hydrolase n=1 Tax=Streptomyces rishiriensis TaxID=68264 RepID=UPI0037D53622
MTDSAIAVLDIDGTLIDSTYQHALARYRALRSVGETYPVWRQHRLIGMGGDHVVTARDLHVAAKERGHRLVLASCGQHRQVEVFPDMLNARGIVDDWTTSADVEAFKPVSDLLPVALKKLSAPPDASSVMVGDSVRDVEAAKGAGMPAIVVHSGGFGDDELQKAGAIALYDTPRDLAKALDDTPLA